MRPDPTMLRKLQDLLFAKPACSGVIDVLKTRRAFLEACYLQARRELAVLAIKIFIIDHQTEEFGDAQTLMVNTTQSLFETSRHAKEFHLDQLLVRLFVQHVLGPSLKRLKKVKRKKTTVKD